MLAVVRKIPKSKWPQTITVPREWLFEQPTGPLIVGL